MTARARLLALMARRESLRAARAARALAEAQRRADAAGLACARLAGFLDPPAPTGPVSAAALQGQRQLLQDIAAELSSQRAAASCATLAAEGHRADLAQHALRRGILDAAVQADIAQDAAQRDTRAEAARPVPRRGS